MREKIIASAGAGDFWIKLWDINSNSCLHSLNSQTNNVWGLLMYDYDRKVLLSVSQDKSIRLWVIPTALLSSTQSRCITTERSMISCFQLTQSTVAVGTDGPVDIWNIETSQLIKSLAGHSDWINQIVSLSHSLIGSCSDDKTIRIWDLDSMTERNVLLGHTNAIYGLLRLSNLKLMSVSYDETIRVWSSSCLI